MQNIATLLEVRQTFYFRHTYHYSSNTRTTERWACSIEQKHCLWPGISVCKIQNPKHKRINLTTAAEYSTPVL